MVKRVIVPFDFHSMSKHILHILSFLIILSITPSSCYLNPQRESDTSEAGLKGKVKYVKLNESYTEEYNKDGYLIKFIYPCNDYDEYKYDWHGYLKEMTSAHLLDYKITCDNTYDKEGRIMHIVSYENNDGDKSVISETFFTYNDQGNLATKETIHPKDSLKLFYRYTYDNKNRKFEINAFISDKDTESNIVEKYDTLGNVLEQVNHNDTIKKIIYFYDSLGFLSEKRFFDIKDSIIEKEIFRCDEHGNWLERQRVDNNGNVLEKETREIEYFD